MNLRLERGETININTQDEWASYVLEIMCLANGELRVTAHRPDCKAREGIVYQLPLGPA